MCGTPTPRPWPRTQSSSENTSVIYSATFTLSHRPLNQGGREGEREHASSVFRLALDTHTHTHTPSGQTHSCEKQSNRATKSTPFSALYYMKTCYFCHAGQRREEEFCLPKYQIRLEFMKLLSALIGGDTHFLCLCRRSTVKL